MFKNFNSKEASNGAIGIVVSQVNMDGIVLNADSKYQSVIKKLDFFQTIAGFPMSGWNFVSEDNGYDIGKSNVHCPELFSKEKPNEFIPKLDLEMELAKDMASIRRDSGVSTENAELYGVYCALFLRVRVDDVLEQENPVDYLCLLDAVELLVDYYTLEEVEAFWKGFEAYFPLALDELHSPFIIKYATTLFGYVLLNQVLNYCRNSFEYYEGIIEELGDCASECKKSSAYREIPIQKCLY